MAVVEMVIVDFYVESHRIAVNRLIDFPLVLIASHRLFFCLSWDPKNELTIAMSHRPSHVITIFCIWALLTLLWETLLIEYKDLLH